MSQKYLTLDAALVEQVAALSAHSPDSYEVILLLGINILEGNLHRDSPSEIQQSTGIEASEVRKIAQAASGLLWECTKGAPKDDASIRVALVGMGFPEELANAFGKVYRENRSRLIKLKGALAISKLRYADLTWRLDVELARRNATVITQPKFMLRLDVMEPRHGQNISLKKSSLHLQADYANLKHMQAELLRALEELASPHCQRMIRYIS